jgi:hypothetical protein
MIPGDGNEESTGDRGVNTGPDGLWNHPHVWPRLGTATTGAHDHWFLHAALLPVGRDLTERNLWGDGCVWLTAHASVHVI